MLSHVDKWVEVGDITQDKPYPDDYFMFLFTCR